MMVKMVCDRCGKEIQERERLWKIQFMGERKYWDGFSAWSCGKDEESDDEAYANGVRHPGYFENVGIDCCDECYGQIVEVIGARFIEATATGIQAYGREEDEDALSDDQSDPEPGQDMPPAEQSDPKDGENASPVALIEPEDEQNTPPVKLADPEQDAFPADQNDSESEQSMSPAERHDPEPDQNMPPADQEKAGLAEVVFPDPSGITVCEPAILVYANPPELEHPAHPEAEHSEPEAAPVPDDAARAAAEKILAIANGQRKAAPAAPRKRLKSEELDRIGWMRQEKGCSWEEIAEETGLPVQRVKVAFSNWKARHKEQAKRAAKASAAAEESTEE